MTKFRIRLEKRHKIICETYQNIMNNNPGIAPIRAMTIIANNKSMSIEGVRKILMRRGLYQKQRERSKTKETER